jgi:hypothetical protein
VGIVKGAFPHRVPAGIINASLKEEFLIKAIT